MSVSLKYSDSLIYLQVHILRNKSNIDIQNIYVIEKMNILLLGI